MTSRHRREGFTGQRHIALPGPIIAESETSPLLKGLFITHAGFYPNAEGHRVTRSKGTNGVVLILCTAGGGWVVSQGRRQEVKAGDLVCIGAHEGHAYGANLEDPWTIEWVHFAGTEAPAWRTAMVGADFFVRLPQSAPASIGLARVYELLEGGYDETCLLLAAVMLRTSLSEILKISRLGGNLPTSVGAVEMTADWMRGHLAAKVTLDALAKMAGMSASRYSSLFRQRFGYAPLDWFMRQRVQYACCLLDATQEKVEVVGREVGFQDPYYFSRSFSKVMGCSPRAYRAIPKG